MNQHLTHVIYGAVIGHFIMALWRKMLSPAPRVIVVPSKPTDSTLVPDFNQHNHQPEGATLLIKRILTSMVFYERGDCVEHATVETTWCVYNIPKVQCFDRLYDMTFNFAPQVLAPTVSKYMI